jgi:hypothetical protein
MGKGTFYLLLAVADLLLLIYTAASFGRQARAVGKSTALWVIVSIVCFFVLATAIGIGVASLIGYLGGWIASRAITVALLAAAATALFRPTRQ